MTATALWQEAAAYAQAHETPWPRDPQAEPAPGQQPWGVHHDDPPPFNHLRGPVHARAGVSGVVIQRGVEVAAWGQVDRPELTFSVAKTYLCLLAGVALGQRRISHLDEAVAERLPGIGFDDEHNRAITWRQLLQQTSEWEGNCFGLPDTVDRWRKVGLDPKPAGGPKGGARPLQAPGTYWEYNDVRINQLALALACLFTRPLPEVFKECLMEPLGASSAWAWRGYDDAWFELNGRRVQSVPGGTHWGGGVSISARDQARLGQLVLNLGQHQGRQLLPEAFVREMSQPCDIAPFYGLLIWLNREGTAFPGASPEAHCMVGAGGHLTWVEPAHQAVVVVRWLDGEHTNGFLQRATAALAANPG